MRTAAITVNDRLEIEISPSGEFPSVTVRLSRITAQHVSAALLEYCGAAAKSFGRERTMTVGVLDITDRPDPEPAPPDPATPKTVRLARTVNLGRRR